MHVFPLVLGTVHASDVEGDTVTYSLLDNVTIFSVSPAGGQVAALGEVTQTYNLTVVGVDSGTPPLTGSASIEILTAGVVTVPATSSTTSSPPHHTSSLLHGESDTGISVILIGTSLGLGSVMVVIAVIISVTVPVCVVKHARQHGEVTLDSKTTRGLVTCHMTVTHVVHVM